MKTRNVIRISFGLCLWLCCVCSVHASIVYSGVKGILVGGNSLPEFSFDLNYDGIKDFTIFSEGNAPFINSEIYPMGAGVGIASIVNSYYVTRFAKGATIGSGLAYAAAPMANIGPGDTTPPHEGNFVNVRGYMGLKLVISGGTRYGWAEISGSFNGQGLPYEIRIHGWAYETSPNTAILAGDTGCASSDPDYFSHCITTNLLPDPATGPMIKLTFTPTNACSLADVAHAFGFDHFNWLQTATEFPRSLIAWGLNTPFIDPPPGGYPADFADNLPFYWDEGSNPGFGADKVLSYHSNNTSLRFLDAPKNPLLLPLEKMSFITQLVGVLSNKQYVVLHTSRWSSTWTGTDGIISTRNPVEPMSGSTGGISGFEFSIPIEQVPIDVIRLLAESGCSDVPWLRVATVGNLLALSWPTNAMGYMVQSSSNASLGIWTDTPTAENFLTIYPTNKAGFFRLIKR